MSSIPLLRPLSLLALATLSACSSSTETFDRRELSISARVVLGGKGSASASGALSEEKDCSLESGEFGPQWDCTSYRNLPGKVTELTCFPTTACADIVVGAGTATFVPLLESFEVHAVGDVEGVRVEKTQTVTATLPKISFANFGVGPDGLPLRVFEGGEVRVCPSGATVVVTGTQDGTPLAFAKTSASSSCWSAATKNARDVQIEVHLARPDRLLANRVEKVAPLSEITRLVSRDQYCEGDGVTALKDQKTGKYFMGLEVRGFTPSGSGLLPGAASHVEGALVAVDRGTAPLSGTSHYFFLESAPAAGAEVVVTAGSETLRVPIRVDDDGTCVPASTKPF